MVNWNNSQKFTHLPYFKWFLVGNEKQNVKEMQAKQGGGRGRININVKST